MADLEDPIEIERYALTQAQMPQGQRSLRGTRAAMLTKIAC